MCGSSACSEYTLSPIKSNACMQHPPPLLEHTAIGHLVGEGVLEGVGMVRKETRFVQELGRLEVRQDARQGCCGELGHGLEQGQGDLCPDDGGGLEKTLLLRWQAVDTRR